MYKIVKRLIDILVSVILLVTTLPFTIIVTVFLCIANAGRPFFIQPRPGKDERVFKLIKFKTMNERKNAAGELLPDNERMTWIGGFVRRASLDELPQLINVLKGDMSLIGPRPLLIAYLPLYSQEQRKRHNIRPGITGWAQINGRNTISWEEKFALDIWYVNNVNFKTDIKIFFLTIKRILKSEGINNDKNVTMPFFTGSK